MDDPPTKPSGSNPASPSSTYSETDKSEVKTPAGAAPAVCASLLAAACGSQVAESSACLPPKSGMGLSSGQGPRAVAAMPGGDQMPRRPSGPADESSPLRRARLARNWTLENAVEEIDLRTPGGHSGVTPSMVSGWELGRHTTSIGHRKTLCEIYEEPPDVLAVPVGGAPGRA